MLPTCPACQRQGGIAGGRSHVGRPSMNSLVVCIACGVICFFDDWRRLQVLTLDVATMTAPELLMDAVALSDAIKATSQTRH